MPSFVEKPEYLLPLGESERQRFENLMDLRYFYERRQEQANAFEITHIYLEYMALSETHDCSAVQLLLAMLSSPMSEAHRIVWTAILDFEDDDSMNLCWALTLLEAIKELPDDTDENAVASGLMMRRFVLAVPEASIQ